MHLSIPMLFQIISYLLEVVSGLLTGACLLRLYMRLQRVPSGNPVGRLVFALTDWLVLPLRKLIPAAGALGFVLPGCGLLLQLVQYLLLWLLVGAGLGLAWLPWMALFSLARVTVSGLMGLLIAYAILSWMQTRTHQRRHCPPERAAAATGAARRCRCWAALIYHRWCCWCCCRCCPSCWAICRPAS